MYKIVNIVNSGEDTTPLYDLVSANNAYLSVSQEKLISLISEGKVVNATYDNEILEVQSPYFYRDSTQFQDIFDMPLIFNRYVSDDGDTVDRFSIFSLLKHGKLISGVGLNIIKLGRFYPVCSINDFADSALEFMVYKYLLDNKNLKELPASAIKYLINEGVEPVPFIRGYNTEKIFESLVKLSNYNILSDIDNLKYDGYEKLLTKVSLKQKLEVHSLRSSYNKEEFFLSSLNYQCLVEEYGRYILRQQIDKNLVILEGFYDEKSFLGYSDLSVITSNFKFEKKPDYVVYPLNNVDCINRQKIKLLNHYSNNDLCVTDVDLSFYVSYNSGLNYYASIPLSILNNGGIG